MSDVKNPTEELDKENEDELGATPESGEELPIEGGGDVGDDDGEEAPGIAGRY